ncbi:MAG: lytic transglycosylase domain-containing protein, partial [Candidatus Latescibacteria bacterium]|nr:lytic transglycosylase domain-containing protein [Candidatus Latescibacterota bacterium]
MKTLPQQRLCGLFVVALILCGCTTGRTIQQPEPEPKKEVVIEASGDRVYDLLRHAFIESHPDRVRALLDSVTLLLPQRFVPEPVAETAAAKRLTSLIRVTLERYHAILPRATPISPISPISPNTPLAMLLDALPASITADLSNHPHYREFKIRALAGLADVPIDLTPEVIAYIQFFRTEGGDFFGRWLSRSTAYLPMIQTVFRNHGLPEDLAYKAMIESGFNPRAVSRASAVGMWQFMRHTGSRYGLKRTTWTDDRMEPQKATEAAAKHLNRLYRHFKDWRLVVAAYNCGQGRMDRAIKESKTRDFWNIDSLPRETRNHLPKF